MDNVKQFLATLEVNVSKLSPQYMTHQKTNELFY